MFMRWTWRALRKTVDAFVRDALVSSRVFGGMRMSMITFLVIVHGLLAMTLLGAVTHQGLSSWRKPAPVRVFFDRFRAVAGGGYTTTIVILYLVTFAFGAYIYPTFVLDVKGSLADANMRGTIGVFQIKEHMAVIGLAILPVYWQMWRAVPATEHVATRRFLTTAIMAVAWWNLVVGHLLNNVKGLL